MVISRVMTPEGKALACAGNPEWQNKWLLEELDEYQEAYDAYYKAFEPLKGMEPSAELEYNVVEEIFGLLHMYSLDWQGADYALLIDHLQDFGALLRHAHKHGRLEQHYQTYAAKKAAKGQGQGMTLVGLLVQLA